MPAEAATIDPLKTPTLDPVIRSRLVPGVNGLDLHVLDAGFETPGRPCLLLLHGFPELAYSWRKLMPALAAAGYHVIAPDQRGYGRTTGWNADYDGDLAPFRILNLVRDVLGLLHVLGIPNVACVMGHDFGTFVAGWCALLRPDVFEAVVVMSAPFTGAPAITDGEERKSEPDIHAALAALEPPRKHYWRYYATREAATDMRGSAMGSGSISAGLMDPDPNSFVHAFLRAYYHYKSADWPGNEPQPLASWSAVELAKLPTYYVMNRDRTMPEDCAPFMPDAAAIAKCKWLTEAELAVYAAEFSRTGFQGGLNWYRANFTDRYRAELEVFAGRTIDRPACFISGRHDWGHYQVPGAIERMREQTFTRMLGCHFVDGAGHWVQQEQAVEVTRLLLAFLASASAC
ncbi:MAG: alpha/beta hydrolase [Gammaproteobacteria bacterium]|nr:alpha/beta hydrolase [Gammaproteobacteria bacterium]